MAKLQEEIIVIKISRLLRDNDDSNGSVLPPDSYESLEAVIQELAVPGSLVEIERASGE